LDSISHQVAPVHQYDPKNDGKIVHYTGTLQTPRPVTDPEIKLQPEAKQFAKSIPNGFSSSSSSSPALPLPSAPPGSDYSNSPTSRPSSGVEPQPPSPTFLSIRRIVEMYQWREDQEQEKQDRVGGSQVIVTTYRYRKVWSSLSYNSSRFHSQEGKENPSFPIESELFTTDSCTIGPFQISSNVIRKLPLHSFRPEMIVHENRTIRPRGDWFYLNLERKNSVPEIGDIRVRFEVVRENPTVSVIGQQDGDRIGSFQQNEDDSKHTTEPIFYPGIRQPEEMLTQEQSTEKSQTWILRLLGWFFNYLGFRFLFRPLETGASLIPFVSTLVQLGATAVSFPSSVSISGITIGLSWLDARAPKIVLLRYLLFFLWLTLCYWSLATIFRFAKNQVEAGVRVSNKILQMILNFFRRK